MRSTQSSQANAYETSTGTGPSLATALMPLATDHGQIRHFNAVFYKPSNVVLPRKG